MALKDIFCAIAEMFEREKADYAVIGAFALHAYGYTRATKDLDFVTRLAFRDKVISFLDSLGFETLHSSDAFSNHLHPVGGVRIDMMYLEGETAGRVFSRVEKRPLFEGVAIPVVHPEHLIAMKLFAAKNDESRRLRDLADIEEIVRMGYVDKQKVREYFIQFGLEAYYHEIEEGLGGN